MIANNKRSTRRWYLPVALFVLLAVMGLTISATLAAPPAGPPVGKSTTGASNSGNASSSADKAGPNSVGGCAPDRDYTYITSTSGIIDPGTALVTGSQCDDCTSVVALPFPISFYGVVTTTLRASSNGNIQLTSNNTTFSNVCLPTTTMTDLIAPFWDDLNLSTTNNASCIGGTCGIFTSQTGPAGSSVFNVEWRGVLFGTTTPVNFEVRFYENDSNNRIDFVYNQIGNAGISATIGLQKGTGQKVTQVSCNTASLVPAELITFQQIPCGQATFTPTAAPTNTSTSTVTSTRTPTITPGGPTLSPTTTNTPTLTRTFTITPTPTITPTAFPTCGTGAPYVFTVDNAVITPGATDIGNHCDDCSTTISIPFAFRYYGVQFTSVSVTSNGAMYFVSGSTTFSNSCLPSTLYNYGMLPYWDDQRTDTPPGGGIFTSVTTDPNTNGSVFNIEWRTCAYSSPCTSTNENYEVQLYQVPQTDGTEFQFVYGNMIGDGSTQTNGNSATVGVQRGTGPDFTQYECNTANSVQNGLALKWKPFGCGSPTLSPTPTRTLTLSPTITLTPSPTGTSTPTFTPRATATCGPDANYTLITSTNGSLVSGTTDIGNHCDDCTTVLTLPFGFTFYGITYATANASSNGNLQFVSNNTTFSNSCLPATTFNYAMFPLWDDLNTDNTLYTCAPGPCGIYTTIEGPVGNRILDIEWRAVYFRATTETVNFEVRLYENPGPSNVSRFDYVYGVNPETNTDSATVGVQRDTGSEFVQYECLQNGTVFPGLLLTFTQPACAGTPIPTVTPACTPYAVGHLTWQTVPQPSSRNQQPLTVTIRSLSGTGYVDASVTADASGFFTVPLGSGFSTGSASWRVKGPRHLATCGSLTVVQCPAQSNFEAGTQRGGDTNPTTSGNNIVNAQDFNTLKAVFGQACTCSSDLDFNGIVNASDFNILKGNFGQAGCGPILGPDSIK